MKNERRIAELREIAGEGTLDERCHRLARYYGFREPPPPPDPPPKPRPRSVARPERVNQVSVRRAPRRRGVLRKPWRNGPWVRCMECNRYLAKDGSCTYCPRSSDSLGVA